ncbi:MAG: methionyl-tRNA formyltransferase [Proteobacteria bacterium]|nr:methionyl-tRNA formyltransferase [Pseudomonadota bacterium]MBU1584026.1 methionyl-tRNA formyltransferase [Pseudomonadota bacterium]MBU2455065.1 methionyl-tRNA formyltransferase [Pseudomonadota bacterium]MBU2630890.1 methionyl-tRNA formyltransferase [Pseudomonadota bacterium]
MGTPDFSVPALQRLAAQKQYHVSLVVTQPDRPKGRGKKLAPSPVKTAALTLGLDVFQPEKINTPEAKERLSSLAPDFFVVAAFGQILSQEILDIPKVFPVNIHASLLPKYRGASPIQAAILNRDKITGITTMVMAKDMDAGDILLTCTTPISDTDTAQDLNDRLGALGADLIVQTLDTLLENRLTPVPQDHSKATYVKLLKKSDGMINWNLSNRQILAHINAMTPWPGALTRLGSRPIKIFTARPGDDRCDHAPGVIFHCDKDGIQVATGNGSLTILELMGASGKRLNAMQFLCGHKIEPPEKFDV